MSGFYYPLVKGSFKLTYAANVLTVSTKGTTKVEMPSATTIGDSVIIDLSGSSWTFQDAGHGTPQILGRWGTTASVAWGSAMPIFIKLVNLDNTASGVKACLTRDPVATISPAFTDNIGILGTAPATSAQTNIVLSNNTNAGYNSKPMILIGACEGTIDNSAGGSMTIIATAGRFGCTPTALDGCFAATWTFPAGQNGAITQGGTATYLYVAGGDGTTDVPTWATNQGRYYYWIKPDGFVTVSFDTSDSGNCSNGDVNTPVVLVMPLKGSLETDYARTGIGFARVNNVAGYGGVRMDTISTVGYVFIVYNGASQNANVWTHANDDISVNFDYKAF